MRIIITGTVPSRIKDLIKLVKHWYTEFVPRGSGQDLSIALNNIEPTTLEAWRKVNSPKTINMAIAFKAVMEELRNGARLDELPRSLV